jgi:hypothetical protein
MVLKTSLKGGFYIKAIFNIAPPYESQSSLRLNFVRPRQQVVPLLEVAFGRRP